MPSRNTIRQFAPNEFYHVYNRGVEKRDIFLDDQDYTVFLGLVKKYLTGVVDKKSHHHKFDSLSDQVELISYCLMPNHIHMLLRQNTDDGITKFMRRLMTGYVMYFNRKYGRIGALFQGKYKAAHVNSDAYLHHISRYIHLNPDNYSEYPYSSVSYYLGKRPTPPWLKSGYVLELFEDSTEYEKFLEEYIDTKNELSVLKWQLANDIES